MWVRDLLFIDKFTVDFSPGLQCSVFSTFPLLLYILYTVILIDLELYGVILWCPFLFLEQLCVFEL